MKNKERKNIPKISVIIPAYNYGRYIEECLKSVFIQTWKNLEIIVVNDGSTDETSKIVENFISSYHSDHIDFIYIYQENKGFPSAHNVGLKKSSGDYVLFLDADDFFWENCSIEKLYYDLSRYDGVMAFGKYVKVWEDGRVEFSNYYSPKKVLSSQEAVNSLILRDFIPLGGALVRGDIARKIGFDERVPFLQDYPFKIRVASYGKVVYCDSVVLGYRQHTTSVSSNKLKMYQDTLKILKLMREEGWVSLSNKIYGRSLSRLYYKIGQEYELQNIFKKAFFEYIRAIIYYPFNYKAWVLLIGLLFGGILKKIRKWKELLNCYVL